MPVIIFIVIFAALEFNYHRGYAAGTEEQKLIYERQFREKEKEHINQFLQMENPALYNYCINELNLKQVLEYCHIPYDKNDYGMGVQLDFEFEE